MKAVIYKTLDQPVLHAWRDLWNTSPEANYINGPQWFLSAITAFHYNDYVIIVVYDNDKLVAISGLVKEKKYGIGFYTIAPSDFVCGCPFLLDMKNETLLKTFVEQLLTVGNITFENMPEKCMLAIKQIIPFVNATRQTISLYFSIKKDEQGKVIIPKRSRLTNRIKGIEEKFSLRMFDGITKEGLSLVFAIDQQSSKEAKGYSAFADSDIKNFYENLEENFKKHFMVHILYFEKKPIAYYIGFIVHDTYYWSQNAYISAYGQYSPGKILLVQLIDSLGSKGITTVNFGSGDYRMKRLLTNEHAVLFQIIISQNAFIRWYVKTLYTAKLSIYTYLYNHAALYSVYRKIKKVLE